MIVLIGPLPEHLARGTRLHLLTEISRVRVPAERSEADHAEREFERRVWGGR